MEYHAHLIGNAVTSIFVFSGTGDGNPYSPACITPRLLLQRVGLDQIEGSNIAGGSVPVTITARFQTTLEYQANTHSAVVESWTIMMR